MAETMTLGTWLALAWVLALLPFLALRRYVDRVHWPVWVELLHGHGARCLEALRDVSQGNAEAVREGVVLARAHLDRGRRDTALARLLTTLQALASFGARTRERLIEWDLACRAALQLVPLPPLRARSFHLGRLRGLALAHGAAHLVPVTSGERFRLRLFVLDRAHVWLGAGATRAAHRLTLHPEAVDAPATWNDARRMAHDFDAVTSEALVSVEALLRSAETFARKSLTSGTDKA